MGLLKKKDPISERARALTAEIAVLEAQIQHLDSQINQKTAPPRSRSNAVSPGLRTRTAPASTIAHAPVFETNDYQKRTASLEPEITPQHFNDLGVRKYDLSAT